MSEGQELDANYLVQAYQAELMDMLRVNVMLKALIAQKDQQLREISNGHNPD